MAYSWEDVPFCSRLWKHLSLSPLAWASEACDCDAVSEEDLSQAQAAMVGLLTLRLPESWDITLGLRERRDWGVLGERCDSSFMKAGDVGVSVPDGKCRWTRAAELTVLPDSRFSSPPSPAFPEE